MPLDDENMVFIISKRKYILFSINLYSRFSLLELTIFPVYRHLFLIYFWFYWRENITIDCGKCITFSDRVGDIILKNEWVIEISSFTKSSHRESTPQESSQLNKIHRSKILGLRRFRIPKFTALSISQALNEQASYTRTQ